MELKYEIQSQQTTTIGFPNKMISINRQHQVCRADSHTMLLTSEPGNIRKVASIMPKFYATVRLYFYHLSSLCNRWFKAA